MKDLKLISKLKSVGKKVYRISELAKILDVKEKSLRTIILRLTKRGVLRRVGRGLYSVFDDMIDPEEIACQLYYPSYISLKTVLSKAGIINQIPRVIQCVTLRKTYKTKVAGIVVSYHQIKKDLFFGYYLKEGALIAYPEKALLDLLYFASLGREYFSPREIDLSKINKKRWKIFKRRYPKRLEGLILKIGKKMN